MSLGNPADCFMQNKPNFRNAQMNVTSVVTMNYERITMNNEPIKQTQFIPTEGGTNPISKAKNAAARAYDAWG